MFCHQCSRQWDADDQNCQYCNTRLSPYPPHTALNDSNFGDEDNNDVYVLDALSDDDAWQDTFASDSTGLSRQSRPLAYRQSDPNRPIHLTVINNHYSQPMQNSTLDDMEIVAGLITILVIGALLMLVFMHLIRWLIIMASY